MYRLLENGDYRLLENGDFRLLEDSNIPANAVVYNGEVVTYEDEIVVFGTIDTDAPSNVRLLENGSYRLLENGDYRLMESGTPVLITGDTILYTGDTINVTGDGSVVGRALVNLTGVSATVNVGALSLQVAADVIVPVSGVQAAIYVGSVITSDNPRTTVELSGVSASFETGGTDHTAGAAVALLGNHIPASVGNLEQNVSAVVELTPLPKMEVKVDDFRLRYTSFTVVRGKPLDNTTMRS